MIEYANETVIKALRQYDMLFKSLKFISDVEQKNDVCLQMTRIIENVLNITNSIYEEKYNKIVNRSTYLMDEERNRLLELINLINERRAYVNNQIANNREVTGIDFEVSDILGEDRVDEYKEQVKIIEKYKNNIKLDGILKDEIANLDVSIKKAQDKISNNKILNRQLEDRMIKLLERSFNNLGLYELQEREKEIDLAYTELGYSLEKAKENAKLARKDCSEEIIVECDNMLASITLEYERYKEKKLILRLIDIYKRPCDDYDSLLAKREEINTILSAIVSSELYDAVGNELNKEYATIKLEQQDVMTLSSLIEEKDSKSEMISDINRENESEEFKAMLSNLLENEKKHQEKLALEKKRKEAELREKKRLEEKRMQEEIFKRQRLLEEERKKEIERRTKQLLDEKKNPILMTDKDETKKESSKRVDSSVSRSDSIKRNVVRNDNRVLKSVNLDVNRNNSNVNKNGDAINRQSSRISDDIFRGSEKKKEIPVIKGDDFSNRVVDVKKVDTSEDIFPKVPLKKEENIFPKFPDKNDSFFDDGEFEDLNKYMESDSDKSWF